MNFGPWIALGCALCWATSVILFRKADSGIPAPVLNLFKNGLGVLLMIPTVYAFEGQLFRSTPREELFLILLSGVIGIGIADTLYLWALELIGASRIAIVECVYAPTVVMMSWLVLGESLSTWHLLGGILIILAVTLIARESETGPAKQAAVWKGGLICAIAMVFMALGIVMVKPLFARVDLFWLIFLRLLAGFLISGILVSLRRSPRQIYLTISQSPRLGYVISASFVGTYLSMICWVAGFKYNTASLAAILNQTTTIFTVLLARYLLFEPLTRAKVLATALASIGVTIITLNT